MKLFDEIRLSKNPLQRKSHTPQFLQKVTAAFLMKDTAVVFDDSSKSTRRHQNISLSSKSLSKKGITKVFTKGFTVEN